MDQRLAAVISNFVDSIERYVDGYSYSSFQDIDLEDGEEEYSDSDDNDSDGRMYDASEASRYNKSRNSRERRR